MAPSTIGLEVTSDHAVPTSSLGATVTVTNVSGSTLFYADNPQVSASNNQGSLTAGQSATFSASQWLRSAALSTVTVTVGDSPPSGPVESMTTANSGAAFTVADVTTATMQLVTLTAVCTLTFPAAGRGKSFTLGLLQDASGSRAVTWPASVKWAGAAAPTLTTTAGKTDVFSFACLDGVNWFGFVGGLNF